MKVRLPFQIKSLVRLYMCCAVALPEIGRVVYLIFLSLFLSSNECLSKSVALRPPAQCSVAPGGPVRVGLRPYGGVTLTVLPLRQCCLTTALLLQLCYHYSGVNLTP